MRDGWRILFIPIPFPSDAWVDPSVLRTVVIVPLSRAQYECIVASPWLQSLLPVRPPFKLNDGDILNLFEWNMLVDDTVIPCGIVASTFWYRSTRRTGGSKNTKDLIICSNAYMGISHYTLQWINKKTTRNIKLEVVEALNRFVRYLLKRTNVGRK